MMRIGWPLFTPPGQRGTLLGHPVVPAGFYELFESGGAGHHWGPDEAPDAPRPEVLSEEVELEGGPLPEEE